MSHVSEISLVSVLVRCRNDVAFLVRTLDALAAQECPFAHEVLVCDDGSTDGTDEILRARPEVRLVPRPAGAYRPGRTLNALVRAARGEIVVFNNADAVPLDCHWLANLIAPLADGSADAAAYVFPSRFEGFGLSLLEAMSAGIPCACSRTSSLGELGAGVAELFDPESPDDIARAPVPALCRRQSALPLAPRAGRAAERRETILIYYGV